MAKTSGDELFERYLIEQGYDPGLHEPSLANRDITTRPDFLPRLGSMQIACEVEQFKAGASTLERRLRDQRTGSAAAKEVYGPIRSHIHDAARQLKPLKALGLPLVIVLANPDHALVDLSIKRVVAAMYGNPQFAVKVDTATGSPAGPVRLELGRDGKLTNDHPYISAVAVLHRREYRVDRIEEIATSEASERTPRDLDEATDQALALLRRLNQTDLPEGDYLYMDVIETASEAAVPLPLEWFAGAYDSRWRLNTDGYYEHIRGPRPQ